MVYSPDADVILLCMLLPVQKVLMLRHNQQENWYDLIDIRLLKNNIGFYINNHPKYAKENFSVRRINYDIVYLSTFFGNDFVPKMETINVKAGFHNIMEAYLKTLLDFKDTKQYLVRILNSTDRRYSINFSFLKLVLKKLIPVEQDFITHNSLYNQYIKAGIIKNTFDYMEINKENIVPVVTQFKHEYDNLKHEIRNRGNLSYFQTHDEFMTSLKKCIMIKIDGQVVNTSYLNNYDLIGLLIKYFKQVHDFPRLNINLDSFSKSIEDPYHARVIKETGKKLGRPVNAYEKEIYKFTNMLDAYQTKFNAEPLDLSVNKIDSYYETYFDVKLFGGKKKLTTEATQVMADYLEGLLWVFEYYYNDMSYINTWSYQRERAPLLTHLSMFLESIDKSYFVDMRENLSTYQVTSIKKYFNPIEQLIYVSPMTKSITGLLPVNYRQYIKSADLDPFLKKYFIDTETITNKLYKSTVSTDIDCHSINYFNKCLITTIPRSSMTDDKNFLKAIRKVVPSEVSERRSKNTFPDY